MADHGPQGLGLLDPGPQDHGPHGGMATYVHLHHGLAGLAEGGPRIRSGQLGLLVRRKRQVVLLS